MPCEQLANLHAGGQKQYPVLPASLRVLRIAGGDYVNLSEPVIAVIQCVQGLTGFVSPAPS